jgi:hypothetical protein
MFNLNLSIMSNFESKVIVAVNNFTGSVDNPAQADKNGKMPVILNVVAGKMPNKAIVQSGTVAERAGLTVGKLAFIQVRETESDDKYGRQFNITKLGDVSPMEALQAEAMLGKPEVFQTEKSGEGQGEGEGAPKRKLEA